MHKTGRVKSLSNSIKYNCQKVSSWSKRPKTKLEIRKKATFLQVISKSIIYNILLTTNRTNRAVVFSWKPFPNIFQYRDHRRGDRRHIEEFS